MTSLRVHPRIRELVAGEDGALDQPEPQLPDIAAFSTEPVIQTDPASLITLQRPGQPPLQFSGRLILTRNPSEAQLDAKVPLHAFDLFECEDGGFVASLRQTTTNWGEKVVTVVRSNSITDLLDQLDRVDPANHCSPFQLEALLEVDPDVDTSAARLQALRVAFDALRYDLRETLRLIESPDAANETN